MHAESFAHQRMADLLAGIRVLRLGVLEEIARQETPINRDIDVFIDCGRNDEAAPVFLVIGREIGAAATTTRYAGVFAS